MGKRGPVTAGAKRTSGAKKPATSKDLNPSTYLSTLAKKYWKSVVASFPQGHFAESDRVLLEQFCVAAALHQESTLFLAEPGDDGKSRRYITDRYGKTTLHPAVKDQNQAWCACAMLATKLRITKTSMISPKVAGRAAQDAAEAAGVNEQFGDLLFGDGPKQLRQ